MNPDLHKIFFDACVSKPLADHFASFFKDVRNPKLKIAHLNDRFCPSTSDPDWLTQIAEEGWIVITADGGKRRSAPKLPVVCSELGVTHVVLWGTLHHEKTDVKRLALTEVFRNLLALQSLPRGTQVRLAKRVLKGGVIDYELRVGAKSIAAFLQNQIANEKSSSEQDAGDGQAELF